MYVFGESRRGKTRGEAAQRDRQRPAQPGPEQYLTSIEHFYPDRPKVLNPTQTSSMYEYYCSVARW